MGVEDEWGPAVPPDKVLNGKEPLNFILDEPTLLRYIDPTMALHNYAAVQLMQGGTVPGIGKVDPAEHDLYWQAVEKNGIISDELSAAAEKLKNVNLKLLLPFDFFFESLFLYK